MHGPCWNVYIICIRWMIDWMISFKNLEPGKNWYTWSVGWAKSQSLALHHTWGNLPSLPRHHGHRHGNGLPLPWNNQENGSMSGYVLRKKLDFTFNSTQYNACKRKLWCKSPWSHFVVQVSICFELVPCCPSYLFSPWTKKLANCDRFRIPNRTFDHFGGQQMSLLAQYLNVCKKHGEIGVNMWFQTMESG